MGYIWKAWMPALVLPEKGEKGKALVILSMVHSFLPIKMMWIILWKTMENVITARKRYIQFLCDETCSLFCLI